MISWWDTPDGVELRQAYDGLLLWPTIEKQVGTSATGDNFIAQKAELSVELRKTYICPVERYRAAVRKLSKDTDMLRCVREDQMTTIRVMHGQPMPDLAPWLHLLKRKT